MDEVRERLKQQCAYKPSLEINFVMSRDSKIACFWGKQFYITDDSFTPELVYETESFVNAASISDGSRYAVCQTAHNARNDEDSGTFAVIDVLQQKGTRKIPHRAWLEVHDTPVCGRTGKVLLGILWR